MSVFSVNPLPTFDLILLQMFAKFSFAIMPKEDPNGYKSYRYILFGTQNLWKRFKISISYSPN